MKFCCDTKQLLCEMTQAEKLSCNHDHCIGPIDIGEQTFQEKAQKLREITGEGMLDCKKALLYCRGDLDQAVRYFDYWDSVKMIDSHWKEVGK